MLHTMNFKSQFLRGFATGIAMLSLPENENMENHKSSRLMIETVAIKYDAFGP